MAARDGSHPDPTHPTLRRYVQAQAIYLGECDPKNKASIVIDNTRFDDPRIVFPQSHASVTKGR
jgi:uridine kinase